jgi:DNA polymerase-3 subunit delta
MATGRFPGAPLRVVWGDDEYAVLRRARQIFDAWAAEQPGGDAEIIDATAANSEEALRAIARLREAFQTLPFFGTSRAVWFRNCNFAGEDRVSEAQSVVEALAEIGRELAAFPWRDVRLVISSTKLDRRRIFFKSLDRLEAAGTAEIQHFPGLSPDDRDWRDKAEALAAAEFRLLEKRIDGAALSRFVEQVGPNTRALAVEAQKLATFVGDRSEIESGDVQAVVTHGRHARAFALGDAVGERQLARALKHLEDELWAIRSDRQKSAIGLLYGLISKVRAMLLCKALAEEGLLGRAGDYPSFLRQLKRLPADRLPTDRRYNPLEINGYVMFRAAQHATNFSREELIAGLEELLRCNRDLVGSGLDGDLILQLAMTRILTQSTERVR